MKATRTLLIASLVLGVISLGSFILGRLAITDIFHGEPDLTLEWQIVGVSFLPVLLFHVLALVSLGVALGHLRRNPT